MASSARLLSDYRSVSATTGLPISGEAHLRQCLGDIISTRISTRVMDRAYGARNSRRMGAPINGETIADLIADTAEAIRLWEPRVTLKRVLPRPELAETGPHGRLPMDLVVEVEGRTIYLEGVS